MKIDKIVEKEEKSSSSDVVDVYIRPEFGERNKSLADGSKVVSSDGVKDIKSEMDWRQILEQLYSTLDS